MLVAKGLIPYGHEHAAHAEAVPFEPKALIAWWSRQSETGFARGNSGGLGFSTPTGQVAAAWASEDGADPPRSRRWTSDTAILCLAAAGVEDGMASAAVTFAERGFSIAWDRPLGPCLVHYLALGGDDVESAAVVRFRGDSEGQHGVRGLGFQPDLVVLAPTYRGPAPEANLLACVGASTATAQAAAGFASADGRSPSEVRVAQRDDAVVVVPLPGRREPAAEARLLSVDADGFTLDWRFDERGPIDVVGLALRGGRIAVGVSSSPMRWRRRRRVRVGFQPAGVLAFTWGLQASPLTKEIGRFTLGGASSDAVGSTCWADHRWVGASQTQSRASDRALLEVVDTGSEGIHARVLLDRFVRDGFTVDWNVRDRVRRQFAYVALG